MTLEIPREVARQLAGFPKKDREMVTDALKKVAADLNFRQPFVTEVKGRPGLWRARKGDWRAYYRIVGSDVVVEWACHKKDSDRWLQSQKP